MVILPDVRLKSAIGPLVVVVSVVVSVTGLVVTEWGSYGVVSPMPNPQPGSPGAGCRLEMRNRLNGLGKGTHDKWGYVC